MTSVLLEVNQEEGGSTPLLLVTIKYHTVWQEWTPGEILCKFTENGHKITNTSISRS